MVLLGQTSTVFTTLGLILLACLNVGAIPVPGVGTSDLSIGDILNLLNLGLVTHINAFITLETLVTNIISVNFEVQNPLPLELTIDRVVSSAGLNGSSKVAVKFNRETNYATGTVFATFDQSFPLPSANSSFIVPIFGSANSGTFGNVTLTQGAIASLGIIPAGELDLINVDVYLRVATIDGVLGIPLPITGLKQSSVNTTYTLDLD